MRKEVTTLLHQALDKNPTLFLIDLDITNDNQIRVIIDGDNGVKVEDCIAVSREIEHNLDEDLDFSIDVMSAGAMQPLTMPRQYKKNVGRDVKVKTSQGDTIEAKLDSVEDESITLKWKTREPKPVGKGKVTVQKEAVIPFNDIIETKVMVKFN